MRVVGVSKSFTGLKKQNQFTTLRDNNFVVLPLKKEEEEEEETIIFPGPFKTKILEKEIAGNKAFLFSISCL